MDWHKFEPSKRDNWPKLHERVVVLCDDGTECFAQIEEIGKQGCPFYMWDIEAWDLLGHLETVTWWTRLTPPVN